MVRKWKQAGEEKCDPLKLDSSQGKRKGNKTDNKAKPWQLPSVSTSRILK